MKINDHDNSPVGIFSRQNTVHNCTNRTLLELPTSGRDTCQSWCRELADFRYRNVRHHRRPIASRINRQQYESRKCHISRYIVTTKFYKGIEDSRITKNCKKYRWEYRFDVFADIMTHVFTNFWSTFWLFGTELIWDSESWRILKWDLKSLE